MKEKVRSVNVDFKINLVTFVISMLFYWLGFEFLGMQNIGDFSRKIIFVIFMTIGGIALFNAFIFNVKHEIKEK